jgi:hypothetical protein
VTGCSGPSILVLGGGTRLLTHEWMKCVTTGLSVRLERIRMAKAKGEILRNTVPDYYPLAASASGRRLGWGWCRVEHMMCLGLDVRAS